MKIPFDAKGHPVKIYSERYEAPGQGMDVMLTIDARIQSILERELNNAMERYNPDSAWGRSRTLIPIITRITTNPSTTATCRSG